MVNLGQIQRGFANFVDREVLLAFEGWQKAIVIGASTLLAANFPKLLKEYGSSPIVSALGIYDPAAEVIDIDALYNAFVPHLGNEKIPVNIPKIGTIKMGRDEFSALLRYIKEA